jgi:hypothetical protein
MYAETPSLYGLELDSSANESALNEAINIAIINAKGVAMPASPATLPIKAYIPAPTIFPSANKVIKNNPRLRLSLCFLAISTILACKLTLMFANKTINGLNNRYEKAKN